MKYNGKELIEMTPEKWDGKSREMLVWCDGSSEPSKFIVVGYDPTENGWIDTETLGWWAHCAEIPEEEPVEDLKTQVHRLKEENEELKAKIKSLLVARGKMANAVSGAVWKEMMERVSNQESLIGVKMPNGLGFNDISDIVLNKILDYKPEKKFRRMTYKELDDWLKQGKGVIRISNHVCNEISYDCEDRNHEVSSYYKICGYDEDTWHETLIEE